jgi:hypothetical protein
MLVALGRRELDPISVAWMSPEVEIRAAGKTR